MQLFQLCGSRKSRDQKRAMRSFKDSVPGSRCSLAKGMYSDSSSTTESSENSDTFPGHRQVALAHYHTVHGHWMGEASNKLQQQYKGQVKLAVYVNYGLITVHVVMGRHMKSKTRNNCNSYVKLAITPDESRRTRCKTELFPDSNNPLYDEKFSFELLEADLDKRLFISVWNRDMGRNSCEFLGCMSFGIRHIYNQTKTVSGWYYLLPGDVGKRKHLQVCDVQTGALADRQTNGVTSQAPPIRPDMLWNDTHTFVIKRSGRGYGFTISGVAPVSVRRLEAGSYAEKVGLRAGDQILKIDGMNVAGSNADSVARIIKHSVRQVVVEVQRPRQVEPLSLRPLERSPRRQPLSHSTPERVVRRPPVTRRGGGGGNGEAMETQDSISPWRLRQRHKPYPQVMGPPSGVPPQSHQNNNAMLAPHQRIIKDLPTSGAFMNSGNSIEEPIYEEPDFGSESDPNTSLSPGIRHHDYGWLETATTRSTDKENHYDVTKQIVDRYFDIPHSVDSKANIREHLDDMYGYAGTGCTERRVQRSLSDVQYQSGTLPRGMKFKTSSRTKLQTYTASSKSASSIMNNQNNGSVAKDYGWLDGGKDVTDYGGSQTSGYASSSNTGMRSRVPVQNGSSQQTCV